MRSNHKVSQHKPNKARFGRTSSSTLINHKTNVHVIPDEHLSRNNGCVPCAKIHAMSLVILSIICPLNNFILSIIPATKRVAFIDANLHKTVTTIEEHMMRIYLVHKILYISCLSLTWKNRVYLVLLLHFISTTTTSRRALALHRRKSIIYDRNYYPLSTLTLWIARIHEYTRIYIYDDDGPPKRTHTMRSVHFHLNATI